MPSFCETTSAIFFLPDFCATFVLYRENVRQNQVMCIHYANQCLDCVLISSCLSACCKMSPTKASIFQKIVLLRCNHTLTLARKKKQSGIIRFHHETENMNIHVGYSDGPLTNGMIQNLTNGMVQNSSVMSRKINYHN